MIAPVLRSPWSRTSPSEATGRRQGREDQGRFRGMPDGAATWRGASWIRPPRKAEMTTTETPTSMAGLTRWVLDHKRTVLCFWLLVTIAAFAAVGPAGSALSQQFSIPGREGFETNEELAAIYGTGGDVAPIVPVVTLPQGTTVDSPGVRAQLDAALARVETALPEAMTASYASTGIGPSCPMMVAPRSRWSTSRPRVESIPAKKRLVPHKPRWMVSRSAAPRLR